MNSSIIACHICGFVQRLEPLPPGGTAECSRCGLVVAKSRHDTLARTAAFTLAALVLYVPANIYPILRMDYHGAYTTSTVWDGCVRLFENGQWIVAVIVFMASILIPLFKLLGLLYLVVTTKLQRHTSPRVKTRVHRVIEIIGPWAMLDVFLLAVLVALVKLGRLATVTPGPGLFAFASVVVLTIMASASFDPRLIWERTESKA